LDIYNLGNLVRIHFMQVSLDLFLFPLFTGDNGIV
jgi:hypothetical protein